MPLIYNVLSTDRKRRKGKRSKAINGRTNGDSISLASLLEAEKLVASVGSIDEAKRALNTLGWHRRAAGFAPLAAILFYGPVDSGPSQRHSGPSSLSGQSILARTLDRLR